MENNLLESLLDLEEEFYQEGFNLGAADGAQAEPDQGVSMAPVVCKEMVSFPPSTRLAKNIDTLLELVDPASLPMQNTEDAVNDVDERLKGAIVKAKLIQRALGEREDTADIRPDAKETPRSGDGTGSIEDISSLSIRH
ncbi:conserved hypothetical protein [Aspergillus terreus NIH2624]|uniref:Uncharacterized protein n=1 Tax=Aspergillus terreus (strain NIH 2624 / FGSC A1156) TaxID=341663 RepID=Q0CCQ7_ASPTN|nr:uncharacterized protein ATEG_08527 [Aspergillus terreus NIH2624]EAU30659.1 conserved hypothetical protein [Aspergillus terreus NIH2624]